MSDLQFALLLGAYLCVGFVVLGGLSLLLFRTVSRGLDRERDVFVAYATSRGLSVTSKYPRASGTYDGVSVTIGVYFEGGYGHSRMITRLRMARPSATKGRAPELAAAIAAFPRSLDVKEGDEVVLAWSGYETSHDVLDEAFRLARAIAG